MQIAYSHFFDGKFLAIGRKFTGQEALALLGSHVVSIKSVENYPIDQIVNNKRGLLLGLDVLLDGRVIDIVGPFDKTQFIESFSYS